MEEHAVSGDGMQRVRLSQWARDQGISRVTAYRMLQRGILPVPSERSPTGRWYVLVPARRLGRSAIYARATPSDHHVDVINKQVADLSEWAATRHRSIFTVVREIADPLTGQMPRLERLLADVNISEIVVHNPNVLGIGRMSLLVAALAPQGRVITSIHGAKREDADLQAALMSLSKMLHGPKTGVEVARRTLSRPIEF